MSTVFSSPFFGLFLSISSFVIFSKLSKRLGSPLANPILLSTIFIIWFLNFFDISLASYNVGGDIITMMLYPVMAVLAYSIYKQKAVLQKYFLSIVIGSLVGSLASIISIIALCKIFGLGDIIVFTMMPKSVTTPIALELSKHLGGLPSITVAAVIITGIMGAMFLPLVAKLFGITNPIATGVGIGTASHGVGTSKAIELGEVQGATSGIAIGVAGIVTVALIMLFEAIM